MLGLKFFINFGVMVVMTWFLVAQNIKPMFRNVIWGIVVISWLLFVVLEIYNLQQRLLKRNEKNTKPNKTNRQ